MTTRTSNGSSIKSLRDDYALNVEAETMTRVFRSASCILARASPRSRANLPPDPQHCVKSAVLQFRDQHVAPQMLIHQRNRSG